MCAASSVVLPPGSRIAAPLASSTAEARAEGAGDMRLMECFSLRCMAASSLASVSDEAASSRPQGIQPAVDRLNAAVRPTL